MIVDNSQSSKRIRQFTAIVGQPGSGKSTLGKNLIEKMVAAGNRCIIVDPDGQEKLWHGYPLLDLTKDPATALKTFKGIVVVEYTRKETFKLLQQHYRNGILMLDDANTYTIPSVEPELLFIMKRKRQYNLDIFTTAHGFTEIPASFFTYITQYALFSTSDDPERRSRNIQHYERVLQVKEFVDEQGKTNPHYVEFFTNRVEPIK